MFPTIPFRLVRFSSALVVLACAIVLVAPLSVRSAVLSDKPFVDVFSFFGVTTGAYALLPFIRRGDIALVAMWVVLGVGVAPCFVGEELSAPHMFGGIFGVLMAAAPIYVARFRQVAQGDIRDFRRRQDELEG